MSKISYVSGNLHRISDHLSEATVKKTPLPGEETAESVSGHPNVTHPSPPAEEIKRDYAELHKHLKPRFDELLRLKRDVNARVAEHKALYSAEAETLQNRKAELDTAVASLDALQRSLETHEIPDFADPDFKSKLADALRFFENARLEAIKAAAKMEGSRMSVRTTGQPAAPGTPFAALTSGELFKKGCLLLLPLILALLFSAILLAAAFFAAWKIAF